MYKKIISWLLALTLSTFPNSIVFARTIVPIGSPIQEVSIKAQCYSFTEFKLPIIRK
jgi:hypothetical protein